MPRPGKRAGFRRFPSRACFGWSNPRDASSRDDRGDTRSPLCLAVERHGGRRCGQYATGTATADITSLTTTGTGSDTSIEPLPAGARLFWHMGRLCSVVGKRVYYSEPFRPGYMKPTNYLDFEANVSVAIANQMGAYIVADKTRWFPNDFEAKDGVVLDQLPYGAIPGTEFEYEDAKKVGWMGAYGFVVGDEQGQVAEPMKARSMRRYRLLAFRPCSTRTASGACCPAATA